MDQRRGEDSLNPFTARMSAIVYTGTTSIHPNGRNFSKPYKAPGNKGHRLKAMAKLNARRNAHKQRESDARDKAKTRAPLDKVPGSMKL